jgi:hypothetical protein
MVRGFGRNYLDQYAANSPTANDPGTTELILTQWKLLVVVNIK